MSTYDCIVIGTGGVGSAALYHLAGRGARTLGLDRFPPGHDRGSSHGDTRIIRLAYFEHPNYVPLLRRAYQLWAELAERRGQQLYHETGLLQLSHPAGEVVPGVLRSAHEHDLAVEELTAGEVAYRFPGLRVPAPMTAVFERCAGYLKVEACVLAYVQEASKLGAEVRSGEAVLGWRADGSGVVVTTDQARYAAARLVITPGAWAADLLGDLGVRFTVRRKSLFWYEAPPVYGVEGCPIFLYETPTGIFYGYPQIDHFGLKVAEHSGGQVVTDPLTVDREIDPQDRRRVEDFLARHLPDVSRTLRRHVVCLYTMSPDGHFIVDRHPRHPQVAFVAGLSGHGFKFACVLGEVLAELALDGRTHAPSEFLACDREM
ncbi:MAG TPA: N-methyl-L-tryptophan oxidase [Candidatus Binatia bacterium]|nr:N-methyl-L-tryptophan oxidase [Candidatus Binatia bacterium]